MQLREALGLGDRDAVSIVGGGGKTTILYGLARETAAAGGKAIATGTTRFTLPEAGEIPPLVLSEYGPGLIAAVRAALTDTDLIVAGAGWGKLERIMPVDPEAI